jgi:hypothetical protein
MRTFAHGGRASTTFPSAYDGPSMCHRSRPTLLAALVVAAAVPVSASAGVPTEKPARLYVVTGTRPPLEITHDLALYGDAAISPRGDRIAFWAQTSGPHAVLELAAPDGSHLTRVRGIETPQSDPDGSSPIVFADGGSTIYTSYVDSTKASDPTVSFRVDVRRAAAAPLPWCPGSPLPAPNRDMVACEASGLDPRFVPQPETVVWRWSGTGTAVKVAHYVGLPLSWTPDGRTLLVQRENTVVRALATVVPGSGVPPHVIFHGTAASVTFLNRGRTVHIQTPFVHCFEVPLAGGKVSNFGDYCPQGIAISATGRRAYVRHDGDLVVTGPHGRHPRVVARYGHAAEAALTWFPGGNRLLVRLNDDPPASH